MTLSKQDTRTLHADNSDAATRLSFYVGPAGTLADLRAQLVITHDTPADVEVIEMLASDVTLPGGMTKPMAGAFLKACRDQLLASAGYA